MFLSATAQVEVRVTKEDLATVCETYRTFTDLLLERVCEAINGGLLEVPDELEPDRVLQWAIVSTQPGVDTSTEIVFTVEVRLSQ